jgi:hypothetical protein
MITCGRCGCCSPLADVSRNEGLSEFLWALKLAGMEGDAREPGFMATVLAPTDGALKGFLSAKGFGSREAVEADGAAKAYLSDVIRHHILPPLPATRAVWTAPFMRPGVEMATLRDGGRVRVESAEGGRVRLAGGAGSGANILKADLYACKGFLNVIDGVLAPY